MGISDRTTADLTLYAEPDGSVSVDTGARYVAVGTDDLTLSPTYRDATTNQYCLTAGQCIDNGRRLLLLDIDAAAL